MKKKKKIIILLAIVFVFAGVITTGVLILKGSADSDFHVTYEVDEDRITFNVEYSSTCFQELGVSNENNAVMTEEYRRKNINPLNWLGIVKRKEVISLKANENGTTKILFHVAGIRIDYSDYRCYKIQVTDEGLGIAKVRD